MIRWRACVIAVTRGRQRFTNSPSVRASSSRMARNAVAPSPFARFASAAGTTIVLDAFGWATPNSASADCSQVEVRLFPTDDVLIGVVEVVVAHDPRPGLVTFEDRQPVGGKFRQDVLKFVWLHGCDYAFCFSLQAIQTRVHGIASSRAGAIGSEQSRHTP